MQLQSSTYNSTLKTTARTTQLGADLQLLGITKNDVKSHS